MQNWWMLYRFIRVWEIPMRLMACVQKRNDPATKVQITKSSCAIPLHSASEESSGRLALRRHWHCESQSRRMIFRLLSRSLNFTHLLVIELTISITLCCAGIIQASRFETTRRMSVSKESNGFLALSLWLMYQKWFAPVAGIVVDSNSFQKPGLCSQLDGRAGASNLGVISHKSSQNGDECKSSTRSIFKLSVPRSADCHNMIQKAEQASSLTKCELTYQFSRKSSPWFLETQPAQRSHSETGGSR
jgi:hypothetical protein